MPCKRPKRWKRPLRIGDVVRLKSGSPRMTVVSINPGGNFVTIWVDMEGCMRSLVASEACLNLVK